MTVNNSDPPVTIKTLYEMVKRLDEKVDEQQVQLAILVREVQKPPAPCPRSQEVYDAVKFDFDVSFIGPGDSGPEIYWLDHWRVIIWDDRADAKPIAECENKSLAKCIEMILDMLRVIDAR